MSAYDLPSSLCVGGRDYKIRSGWRHILKILEACADPTITQRAKTIILLRIFYPEWKSIPPEHIHEACEKASEFIDCGQKKSATVKPRLIDWEQDAAIIMPAINNVANLEVRSNPNIHWWTFFGWFMAIENGLFASVLRIRQKISKHQKLEKYEEEFYRSNKEVIDLKTYDSAEVKAAKDDIRQWLEGDG